MFDNPYKNREVHNFLIHSFGAYEFSAYTRCTISEYDDIS